MYTFKKSTTLSGKLTLTVRNGMFIDEETGEIVNLPLLIESVYGSDEMVDITVKHKVDQEIEADSPNEDGDLSD